MHSFARPTGRLQRALPWFAALDLVPLALGAGRPARALDLSRLTPAIARSGAVASELREVGHCNALRVNSHARVLVRQAERPTVKVRGEANVLPLLEMRVENGSLVVQDARRFTSSAAEVVVTVRRSARSPRGVRPPWRSKASKPACCHSPLAGEAR